MRTRATLLLTAAVLLGACASDPAGPTATDTPTELPPATSTPTEAPSASTPASPANEPAPTTSPDPDPEPEPEPEPEPAATATATATTVTIADFAYAPESVEVAVGGTVTWTNEDSTAHTATVSDGPDTGAIGGGASGSVTFDAAGTYDYVCQFHPGSMSGTVVVR